MGVSDVYYTHYHGDHISFESDIYRAGVTQHIGALSLEMIKTLKRHMTKAEALKVSANNSLEALERFKTYTATVTETVGDIRITPYFVSHSAADAHMFLIECDGITVLHTGDFRDHGYMGAIRADCTISIGSAGIMYCRMKNTVDGAAIAGKISARKLFVMPILYMN